VIALDLFAGHGWGVACQRLGIEELGVEIMPEAVATRKANGMTTIFGDVWEGLEGRKETPRYDLLIASPPCQTFSVAGGGAGRVALDEVLALIDSRAFLDVARLRAFGETHDPRTALVLTPIAHVARDLPRFVVFEQVPPVLPVWEACARVMRIWGYSVVTGILNAEQYGVPQTRKRAILVARLDGVEAEMPAPSHSRYHPRDKARRDPGVLPWVSMAEALGWGVTERPYLTIAPGTGVGASATGALGGSGARRVRDAEMEEGRWLVGFARKADERGPATADGYRERDLRDAGLPAQHVTGKARSWTVRTSMGTPKVDGVNGTHELDPDERPAHTVTSKTDSWTRIEFEGHQYPDNKSPTKPNVRQRRPAEEPAPTIQGGTRAARWTTERPATTLVGTFDPHLVRAPGHTAVRGEAGHHDGLHSQTKPGAVRVTIEEAALLQSYPAGFTFAGSKTKQFLQVGNAVPPLLAEAIPKEFQK
jgi:DNA (cytosine-5)-methyltransferase 1